MRPFVGWHLGGTLTVEVGGYAVRLSPAAVFVHPSAAALNGLVVRHGGAIVCVRRAQQSQPQPKSSSPLTFPSLAWYCNGS